MILAFVETSLSGNGLRAMGHARNMGAEVLLLVRDLGYYTSHGGTDPRSSDAIAEIVECQTNDPDEVTAVLSRYQVEGVLSAGEHHVSIAAQVAMNLGATGLSVRAATTARDKGATFAAAAAAGALVPRFETARSPEAALAAAERIGYPCVVKPTDGTGSTGVRYCTDRDDVLSAAEAALAERRNARDQLRTGELVVAEYVVGHEVSVEVLAENGVLTVIGVTDKHTGPLPWFVETGHTFPSVLPPRLVAACGKSAVDVLTCIGFDTGMAHIEFRVSVDGPVLMEVNARPGGDRIMDLIRLAFDFDPLEAWVRLHAGMAWQAPGEHARGAAIRYLLPPPGRVRRVWGQEQLRGVPGVVDASVTAASGKLIAIARSSGDRWGYVITSDETPMLAEREAELAINQLMISVAPFVPGPGNDG